MTEVLVVAKKIMPDRTTDARLARPTFAAALARSEPQAAAILPALRDPKLRARQAILHGPVLATMLRLAWPTLVVLVAQVAVGVAETFYVSYLGTSALAGVALVFPILMLMAMMSNGALGGGVASAVARALGAGRKDDANALVMHALIIAVAFGLLFTGVTLLLGRAIYGGLGGTGAVLDAALTYSAFVFVGAVPSWIVSLLAAALRGAGNVKVPARVTLISAVVLVVLSPALIFGFGPLPRLGIAGAGTAVSAFNVVAAIALIQYMRSGRSVLVLKPVRLEQRLFAEILRVGLLSAVGTAQFNLTVLLVTAAIGALVAIFPTAWLRLFSSDANVLATGTLYLRIVGPAYGFVGLGMLLYFASQGASRVLWPVLAGTVRLIIAALFGWAAVVWLGFSESALFTVVAIGAAMFGGLVALATCLQSWSAK